MSRLPIEIMSTTCVRSEFQCHLTVSILLCAPLLAQWFANSDLDHRLPTSLLVRLAAASVNSGASDSAPAPTSTDSACDVPELKVYLAFSGQILNTLTSHSASGTRHLLTAPRHRPPSACLLNNMDPHLLSLCSSLYFLHVFVLA